MHCGHFHLYSQSNQERTHSVSEGYPVKYIQFQSTAQWALATCIMQHLLNILYIVSFKLKFEYLCGPLYQ